MKLCTAISTALILTCGQIYAQDAVDVPEAYNAETMLNLCMGDVSDTNPEFQSMTCTFRLQGVGDTMLNNCASRDAGYEPAPELTASVVGSRGAIRQTFVNYMEDHPEVWGEHWSWVVALAFADKFPCEN